ncbi:MerR family transcriptional regulator [Vibrio harveyi]|uniref:MerR family transcriptional regulator n=1 Tax=Vibrio harveyi TaxID=669 RepID=UPI00247FCBBF|nr:MerR family transcriptional regulator [Vibrio harveyi]
MNMSEFSERVELSPHTLRYYEKIGLLKNIQRSPSGHRMSTAKDLSWIGFVKRLKDTAMPLEELLKYADLREVGESTIEERQVLLEKHQEKLTEYLELQKQHLAALEAKINLYKQGKVR